MAEAKDHDMKKEAYDIFRVRKTLNKMLDNRGYLVGQRELKMTSEEFKTKFDLNAQSRDQFTILVNKKDDPTDELFVFFPDDAKVGVKPIRQFLDRMKERDVQKAIIVVKEGVTPFAKSAVNEMAPKYMIEHFRQSELLVDITEHKLVPKHYALSPHDKKQVREWRQQRQRWQGRQRWQWRQRWQQWHRSRGGSGGGSGRSGGRLPPSRSHFPIAPARHPPRPFHHTSPPSLICSYSTSANPPPH